MKWNKKTRRHFLQGAGNITLALPFLPSLFNCRELMAQSLPKPFYMPIMGKYGYPHHKEWFPTQYNLNSATTGFDHHNIAFSNLNSLKNTDGSLSPIMSKNVGDLSNFVTLIRGLDITSEMQHNSGAAIGNFGDDDRWAKGPTIDTIIANSRSFYEKNGNGTPLIPHPVIRATTGNGQDSGVGKSQFHEMNGSSATSFSNPKTVFDTLFKGIASNPTPNPEPAEKLNRDKLLVDGVLADFQSTINRNKNGKRALASADKTKLENHMEFIFQIESNINSNTTLPPASCPSKDSLSVINSPQMGQYAPGDDRYISQNEARSFLESIVDTYSAAIACGLTRIACLTVNQSYAFNGSWHGNSHSSGSLGAGYDNQILIVRFLIDHSFARAAKNLFDYGVLDQGLVHFSLENSMVHTVDNMPCLTAGSIGGKWNSGRFIDYWNHQSPASWHPPDSGLENSSQFWSLNKVQTKPGLMYNRFLLSLMKDMGVQSDEYSQYGNGGGKGFGYYNANWRNGPHYNVEDRDQPLPFLGKG